MFIRDTYLLELIYSIAQPDRLNQIFHTLEPLCTLQQTTGYMTRHMITPAQ